MLVLVAGQTCRLLRKASARMQSSNAEMEISRSSPPYSFAIRDEISVHQIIFLEPQFPNI